MTRLVHSVNSLVVLPVEDSESVKVGGDETGQECSLLVVLPVEDSESVKVGGDETGKECELAGGVAS